MSRKIAAEFLGTFWLTFGGCGAAVVSLFLPQVGVGIGVLGVAIAFGLSVLTMAYAVGHISGGHFNPAVTVGVWAAGRFEGSEVVPYVAAQVVGAIAAAALLFVIASGAPGFELGRFAANGFGELSPGKYSLAACLLTEVLMTGFFVLIILGATSPRAPAGFAPIAIGLALTLIHLVSIPITATSVNPARSTGPALFAGGAFVAQLWLFWLAPIVGALIAGKLHAWLLADAYDTRA